MRIGYSKDIHILELGFPLYLGGIKIESNRGGVSYSDGDVLLHAIVDSLIGAMGLGDIGEIFKDTDIKNKNRPSSEFLMETKKLLEKNNYKITYIDTLIILEEPKLFKYKQRIKENIANLLDISPLLINIKAGTNEQIGEIGRNEAIEAHSIVILEEI